MEPRSGPEEGSEPARGLLDTSVVIALEQVDRDRLPDELSISTITLAELVAGVDVAADGVERAKRLQRLQRAQAVFEMLPFDIEAAESYGPVAALTRAMGRNPRGRRLADLLIASVASANHLPLYTRNAKDFAGLEDVLRVVVV